MKNKNKPLAKVFHAEIQGKRNDKYEYLLNNSITSVQWQQLDFKAPYHFFVPKDFNEEKEYELGFKVDEIFLINNSGISTDRDSLFVDIEKVILHNNIQILLSGEYSIKFRDDFNVVDSSGYPLLKRIANKTMDLKYFQDYHYRPFDIRNIYYDSSIISRPAKEVSKHVVKKDNIVIIAPRQVNDEFHHVFISRLICDSNITSSARLFGAGRLFPLYLYPDAEKDGMYANAERTPNLNMEIVNKIAEGLGLEFVPEKEETANTFAPIDILDYIYAVLHSPTYRETYKEFLKIDFPRVPYPHSLGTGRDLSLQKFWKLVQLGGEIRQIHLLESPIVEDYITEYPEDGTNEVEKIKYDGDRVYINSTQYFDNVPEVAWNFYIGGYQPAQKWLKDRKGRVLNFDDILHYQKIIVALTETDRLMKAVDELIKEEGE